MARVADSDAVCVPLLLPWYSRESPSPPPQVREALQTEAVDEEAVAPRKAGKYKRPRGRAPKGKKWNDETGEFEEDMSQLDEE